MKRLLLVPVLWALAACVAAGMYPRTVFSSSPPNPSPGITAIKVVLDDNYPPYVFRDRDGRLQGILIDQWRLWQEMTGIRAELYAMGWGEALRRMEAGEFDVIDTIFRNEPRERVFEFSKPYAYMEVPVFFHKNISGITDAWSLKGFPVAVKNGDAAVDFLRNRGVERLIAYDSYEKIVRAARDHEIGVFVMDRPPAMHLLYKMGIHDQFRMSRPLYSGQFHRAVRKGNGALLAAVEDGFARIPPKYLREIEQEWLGSPALSRTSLLYLTAAIAVGGLSILLLAAWNFTLRRSVERKTSELKKEIALTADQAVKLRASEENYRLLVENAGDGITIVHEGRVLYVNPGASRIIGIPPGELLGRSFLDVVHAEDRERIQGYYVKRMGGEETPSRYEFRAETASGETVWVQATVVGTMWEGKQVALSFLRDITQQKRLEEQLVQSRKMEAIGRLAGGIAHDFNNILTAVMGYLSLAKLGIDPGDQTWSRLVEAEKAAIRAQSLTRQLLTFSKGGAPVRQASSIGRLVEESANFALRGSTILCRITVAEDLSPVDIDLGQIGQVLNSIVLNAAQASPEGGVIRVDARNISVEKLPGCTLPPGDYVKIDVEDRGTGIPEENVGKIFNPFFTTKEKGTGLGLATAYSIVKRHEGAITVDSAPGRGTTVSIFLPAAAKDVRETPDPGPAPHPGIGKILVMDDEEMVRDVAVTMLQAMGYEGHAAKDGSEAVDAYLEAMKTGVPYDAVILDLTVPGAMGGKEAVRRLLDIDPGAKVIVSSGYSQDPILAMYRDYGFSGVIAKPYQMGELAQAIRMLLPDVAPSSH